MDTTQNTTAATQRPTRQPPAKPPTHGERAAELIFDAEACPMSGEAGGGAWVYPACYDDFTLARRCAWSLQQGFGIPFTVDLLGVTGEPWSIASASVAIGMPGYYAFTTHDPRPYVIHLPSSEEAEPEEGSDQC